MFEKLVHKMLRCSCDICYSELEGRHNLLQEALAKERSMKETAERERDSLKSTLSHVKKQRDEALKEVAVFMNRTESLDNQCKALHHENFELRGRGGSNLMSSFPTNDEVSYEQKKKELKREVNMICYVELNEQTLVSYILDHAAEVNSFEQFFSTFVSTTLQICDNQFDSRLSHITSRFSSYEELHKSKDFLEALHSLKTNINNLTMTQENVVVLKNKIREVKEDEAFEKDSLVVAAEILALAWRVKLSGMKFAKGEGKYYRQLVKRDGETFLVFGVITYNGHIVKHGYSI